MTDSDLKHLRAVAEGAIAGLDTKAWMPLLEFHREVVPATVLTLLDRIQAQEGERESLHLAICGGEDAPGYAASLSHEKIVGVLKDNYASWKRDSELAWDGETANTWKARAEAAEARALALEGALELASDTITAALEVADQAREEWDMAPSGMRAGKLLIALAGGLKGYRIDIDAIHANRAKIAALLPQQKEAEA